MLVDGARCRYFPNCMIHDGSVDEARERAARLRHDPKLNEDEVREIRRRYAVDGEKIKDLATAYGVCYATVYDVVRRRTWRWL